MRLSHYKVLLCLALLLSLAGFAQEKDTTIYKSSQYYLDEVRKHVADPVVLAATDSLFIASDREGKSIRKAAALAFKADYYYYTKDWENLKIWADSVKSYSKAHNHPIYYYFTWQRLINFYIESNYLTYAIRETDDMKKEAVDSWYYPGIVNAERLRGRIYMARGMYPEAKEAYEKAVTLLESAPESMVIPNPHLIYVELYQVLKRMDETENAPGYLKKALDACVSNNQRHNVYGFLCDYYLNSGDLKKARQYLNESRAIEDSRINPISVQARKLYLSQFYSLEGKTSQALAEFHTVDRRFCNTGTWRAVAIAIYERGGMYEQANELLEQQNRYQDSLSIEEKRSGIREQMMLMESDKVQSEADKQQIKVQTSVLRMVYVASFLVIMSLLIMVTIVSSTLRLKKKLLTSEKIKGDFLRHLSHEVRTPLNGLVGFSDLVAESKHDPELAAIAKKIHKRSSDLIELIVNTINKIGLILLLVLIPLSALGTHHREVEINEAENDGKYTALLLSMEYYMDLMSDDSVRFYYSELKEYSKSNDYIAPYYLACEKYISYFIQKKNYESAIVEINLMQEDAMETDYYPGIIEAEKMKGDLFFSAGLTDESVMAYARAVELMNNLPKEGRVKNAYSLFLSYGRALMEAGRYDDVPDILEHSIDLCSDTRQRYEVFICYSSYYRKIGDPDRAREYLSLAKSRGYGSDPKLRDELVGEEMMLEMDKGNYSGALALSDSLSERGSVRRYADKYIRLYRGLKDYEKANSWYHARTDYLDSLSKVMASGRIEEQVAQLNMSTMRYQNDKKLLVIREKRIRVMAIITIVAVIILIILFILSRMNLRFNKRLQASNDVKSQFIRNLSRDINVPLDDIVRLEEVVIDVSAKDESLCEYSAVLRECVDQITKLVNDSVDMTEEYKPGKREFERINTCLYLAEDYIELPIKDGVNLTIVPNPDNPFVLMDKNKVVKILSNLLHNASKFTYKGEIVIRAEVVGDDVEYSVSDSGIGIPANRREDVFEYFTKIDTMSQGLGLGLPLSRRLARHIDGTLELDTKFSPGCRFVLRFPFR